MQQCADGHANNPNDPTRAEVSQYVVEATRISPGITLWCRMDMGGFPRNPSLLGPSCCSTWVPAACDSVHGADDHELLKAGELGSHKYFSKS